MREVLNRVDTMGVQILEIRNDQKKLVQMCATQEHASNLQKIRDWISPTSSEHSHQAALNLYQRGTGQWVFDLPEYKNWIEDKNSALWVYAIPGAGKTILASLIIKNLLSSQGVGTAYFYCSYKNVDSQRPTNILGSLITQLALLNQRAFQEVWESYENCSLNGRLPDRPNEATLCKLLKIISKQFDEVTIVIDGLDECGSAVESFEIDRPQFVLTLSTLHNKNDSNIRLLILSRDEVDIRAGLRDFPSISIAAKSQDLRLYVHAMAKKLNINDQGLRSEIIDALINGAEGMFQWVRCQIDYLGLLPNDRDRRKALKKLPPTLPAIYIRILEYLDSHYPPETQNYIRRTLTWLTMAKTPLSMPELAEAISIDENSGNCDHEAIPDEAAIRQWCSTFIKVEPAQFLESDESSISSTVATKYLVRRQEASNYIVHTCLTYLSSDVFNEVYSKVKERDNVKGFMKVEMKDTYCFYGHAASCLHKYMNDYDYELEEPIPFRRLLTVKPTNAFSLLCIYWNNDNIQELRHESTSVKVASGFLLPRTVKRLLAEGGDPNGRSDTSWTPLLFAITRPWAYSTNIEGVLFITTQWDIEDTHFGLRRLEVVELLISAGANINTPVLIRDIRSDHPCFSNPQLMSPLSLAIESNLPDISLLLLDRGARVTPDDEGFGAQYCFLKHPLIGSHSFARRSDMNKSTRSNC
ncbi:hypothetical protein MMC17_003991 [Xylographa soralifera]|nr:hypothetical protein [Xylographa soralifera]